MIVDGNELFTVSTLYFVTSVFVRLQISSFVKSVATNAHVGILGAFLVCYVIIKTNFTIKLSVTFYAGYLCVIAHFVLLLQALHFLYSVLWRSSLVQVNPAMFEITS